MAVLVSDTTRAVMTPLSPREVGGVPCGGGEQVRAERVDRRSSVMTSVSLLGGERARADRVD